MCFTVNSIDKPCVYASQVVIKPVCVVWSWDVLSLPGNKDDAVVEAQLLGEHAYTPSGTSEPITFNVTRGDYAPLMRRLSDNLQTAMVRPLQRQNTKPSSF